MSELLRNDLVATITRWETSDPESAYLRVTWLALATDPRWLVRDADPAHFTASALPMTADGSRVCLVLHRRMRLWVQPGGHLEPVDRSVAGAAAREMGEETGLSGEFDPAPLALSRHHAPCRPGAWHLDVQMLAISEPAGPLTSDGWEEAAWFDSRKLPSHLAPGVAELVGAGLQRVSRSASPAPPPPEG